MKALQRLGTLVATTVFLAAVTYGGDMIRPRNTHGQRPYVLVDGESSDEYVNDLVLTAPAGMPIFLANLTQAPLSFNNEIIGFAALHPPKLFSPTPLWTDGDDVIDVPFQDLIQIPVTVWVVAGSFPEQKSRAEEACIWTSKVWKRENMGLRFSEFRVIDATSNPSASVHRQFDADDFEDAYWKPIRDDIGFQDGQINIYFVDTVEGSTTWGYSNFYVEDRPENTHQIVMGSETHPNLMVHEIGHAFFLEHTAGNPLNECWSAHFDHRSIMAPKSDSRRFVAEGQSFRAHVHPRSALNAVYDARPGEPQRECGHCDDTWLCPPLFKRVWPDDVFAAD